MPDVSDTAKHGWRRVIAAAIGLSVVTGVLVTAFVWPTTELEPRQVPIAVTGPAAGEVEQQIAAAMPDAFEVTIVDDEAAARDAINEREVYGAAVVDPSAPPHLLIASAASPIVAQLINELGMRLAGVEVGPGANTVDVVPLPDDDPRGAGFNAGALPMVMAGLAIGVAMSLAMSGAGRRVVGALLAALGGGAAAALVTQTWLGVLEGAWAANAGAYALTMASIALLVIGLHALIGQAGIGIAALALLIVGNPLSGVTSAPELLPSGWSDLGQAMPPGAGGQLLRSTSFFDGAAAGQPLLVLSCWAAGGLALIGLAALRSRRAGGSPASSEGEDVVVL